MVKRARAAWRQRFTCLLSVAGALAGATLTACGGDGAPTGVAPTGGVPAPVDDGKPEGWSEESHGKDAEAAYDLIFSENQVNRIDITIEPSEWKAMLDDMTSMAGELGQGGGLGPPILPGAEEACAGKAEGDACEIPNGSDPPIPGTCVAGPSGEPTCAPEGGMGMPPQPPPELIEACAGKAEDEACEFTLNGQPGAGTCKSPPWGGELMCLGDVMGGPGGGGEDAEFFPRTPIYVESTVRFNEKTWPHVGIRLKGNSTLMTTWSRGVYKLPFRIKFDEFEAEHPEIEDQRFYGFKSLSLTNNAMDTSYLRDKVVADVLREGGVPAARTVFTRIFIDHGEGPTYFGLYTLAEVPDEPMLRAQFGDDSGNLYKPQGAGARLAEFDAASFEKKTNETEADFSDVKAAIAALNASRDDAALWRSGLDATLDTEGFLRWLALNTVIGNWDVYGALAHNYYLYGDPQDGGRLSWIPWDHDLALAGGGPIMLDNVGPEWPLIRFLIDDPVYRAQYIELVKVALSGAFSPEPLAARLKAEHDRIKPYVVGPEGEIPAHTFIESPEAFEASLSGPSGLLGYIEERHAEVQVEIGQAQ